jgi:hypothetical protein
LEDELNCNLCTLARATRGKDLDLMNIKSLWKLHGGKRCDGANVKRWNLEVKLVVFQQVTQLEEEASPWDGKRLQIVFNCL